MAADAATQAAGKHRLTTPRRLVFELLEEADAPLKAYELLARYQLRTGVATAPPTIYRALEFWVAQHAVHHLPAMSAYVLCRHQHSHLIEAFLICDQCKKVTELEVSQLGRELLRAASAQGFEAQTPRLELHGRCQMCKVQPSIER